MLVTKCKAREPHREPAICEEGQLLLWASIAITGCCWFSRITSSHCSFAVWQTYLKTEHIYWLQCRSILVCFPLSGGPSASASLSKRPRRKVCVGTNRNCMNQIVLCGYKCLPCSTSCNKLLWLTCQFVLLVSTQHFHTVRIVWCQGMRAYSSLFSL